MASRETGEKETKRPHMDAPFEDGLDVIFLGAQAIGFKDGIITATGKEGGRRTKGYEVQCAM